MKTLKIMLTVRKLNFFCGGLENCDVSGILKMEKYNFKRILEKSN